MDQIESFWHVTQHVYKTKKNSKKFRNWHVALILTQFGKN